MNNLNEHVHPLLTADRDRDGAWFCQTDQDARGITERLAIGAQVLAALVPLGTAAEFPQLVQEAELLAATADVLAVALMDQQHRSPNDMVEPARSFFLSRQRARQAEIAAFRAAEEIDQAEGQEASNG